MSTTIDEVPLIGDSKSEFNRKAFKAWGLLQVCSIEWNIGLANVDSAVTTVSAGLSAGLWVSGTTYAIGNLRFDPTDGLLYRRLTAGAGTTRPALDATNWALQTLPELTLIVDSSAATTGIKNREYWMSNTGAVEFTLPASPAVGDVLRVGFANGRFDNWVRRNGQSIMGKAEDMLINIPYYSRRLRFMGGATGWGITR